MTALYCILCFAAGFLFGVFATALVAMSGDKSKRDYDKLEMENRVLKVANDELRRQKKELIEKWESLADEFHIPKEGIYPLIFQQ